VLYLILKKAAGQRAAELHEEEAGAVVEQRIERTRQLRYPNKRLRQQW
jgi:hypothetical protein